MFNSAGAEAGIFWERYVDNMAADVLGPHGIRSAAAMVLSVWDKRGFSLPVGKILTSCPTWILRIGRKREYILY